MRVLAVVDSGKSEKDVRLCQEAGVLFHLVSVCHGTARTEMLDLLGLGETKKETVLCMITADRVRGLLERLADQLQMRYPGKGIVFSVPLTQYWKQTLSNDRLRTVQREKGGAACEGAGGEVQI